MNRLIRLAVLIEHGTFRRAAERLGVTQSALSQSIAQIETEVGVKLIERTSHGAEPTIYGRALYSRARAIDRELAQATQEIQELTLGRKGVLTVGATAGAAGSLIATAVCKLLRSYPGTNVNIIEEASIKSLLTQLRERHVDMLMCQQPHGIELKGVRAISLFRAKRVACVRANHPLTGQATLGELAKYPFVCPPEELGEVFGFRQFFSMMGLSLPTVLVSNSIHASRMLVVNSDAFALFSDLFAENDRELRLVDLVETELPGYWMQLILREEHTPTDLMRSFVGEVLALCQEIGLIPHRDAMRF